MISMSVCPGLWFMGNKISENKTNKNCHVAFEQIEIGRSTEEEAGKVQ